MPDADWLPKPQAAEIPRLALRPREAAIALGISEKTLWTLTEQKILPCIKIKGTKLYAVDALRIRLDELTKNADGQPLERLAAETPNKVNTDETTKLPGR